MESIIKINKIYDELSYFDLYGGSLILITILTIIIFLLIGFTIALHNSSRIKANWEKERCNPVNMPFVGFINKPPNYTVSEFTKENINYCTKNVLTDVTGAAFEPLNYITSSLTNLYTTLLQSIQSIRIMVDSIRKSLTTITDTIFTKMINIIIPLNQITLAISDMMGKTTGILTVMMYSVIGAFDTLKSLFGAILQTLELLLIPIAAFIIICLVLGAFYLAIAPSLVAATLGTVIGLLIAIQTLMGQGIAVNSCFDKNTPIQLLDGSIKYIKDIRIGDKLQNNDLVNATMKLSSEHIQMYKLNGLIISGTHYVEYNNKFIQVKFHPKREKVLKYCEPFIYCISTSSKKIIINNIRYLDWDDYVEDDYVEDDYVGLNKEVTVNKVLTDSHIFSYLHNTGYSKEHSISLSNKNSKAIKDIQINDILLNGEKVTGLVEFIKEDKYLDKSEKLYQLLTNNNSQSKFKDYDSTSDLFLSMKYV